MAARALKSVLDKTGVSYKFFDNGKRLLEFIDANIHEMKDCAFIITDLEMPEVSGFEVIKSLKSRDMFASLPLCHADLDHGEPVPGPRHPSVLPVPGLRPGGNPLVSAGAMGHEGRGGGLPVRLS